MTDPFALPRVELVKDTDVSWDSPHHTLGRGPTQAAVGNHRHESRLSYFNRSNDNYLNLAVNTYKKILFNYESPVFAGTSKAVSMSTVGTAPNDYSVFTFLKEGTYQIIFELEVYHATVGTNTVFQLQGIPTPGSIVVWSSGSVASAVKASTGVRLVPLSSLRYFGVGESFYIQIYPYDTAGWASPYCNLTITQASGISDVRPGD